MGPHSPEVIWPHALRGVDPGAPSTVRFGRETGHWYLGANDAVNKQPWFTIATGWKLLCASESFSSQQQALLDWFWVAIVDGWVGVWARQRGSTAVALAILGVSIVALAPAAGLVPPTTAHLGAITTGLLMGMVWRRCRKPRHPVSE